MTPFLQDADVTLYHGDVLEVLSDLPSESVDCVVTSPPYWSLRDYGTEGQIGLEETPDEYVAALVQVFGEVRRVCAPHATVWCNLGDTYAVGGTSSWRPENSTLARHGHDGRSPYLEESTHGGRPARARPVDLKPKDLVGIPWRVAFALQADGWWLRSDIIWAKPNPMPESVTDRPTKSHEYVFLLTRQPRYFFDQEAVREADSKPNGWEHIPESKGYNDGDRLDGGIAKTGNAQTSPGLHRQKGGVYHPAGRNVRSVWTVATQPYPEAHFATYPEELVRRCVLAGCPERVCAVCGKPSERIVEREPTQAGVTGGSTPHGEPMSKMARGGGFGNGSVETLGWSDCGHNTWRPGLVLDPFVGSGTTCKVARDHGRHSIGIDLSADYLKLAARRLQQQSLFSEAQA